MRSRGINLLHVLQGKKEGGGDARGDEWVEKQGDGDGEVKLMGGGGEVKDDEGKIRS